MEEVLPGLLPTTVDGGPGWGPYSYRYASGRTGRSALVSLHATRSGVSLHVRAVGEDGRWLVERYADQLRPASVGRSCVRLRGAGDVDVEVLRTVLREAARCGPAAGVLDPAADGSR